MMGRSYGVLVAVCIAAASLNAPVPRIRDSAGVRIIENPSRLNAPIAFKLADKPSFDVGGLETNPENEISSRQGYFQGIRLSDGRVAVVDQSRIHFFNAAGKRLKIVGREGSGPGEFRNVTALCRIRGDSVFVTEGQNRRVTILNDMGGFVAAHPLGQYGYSEREFCFDDGTVLAMQRQPPNPPGRPYRLNHVRRDGTLINVIADVDLGAFDMAVRRETQTVASGQKV
jgi:hypothetical protein